MSPPDKPLAWIGHDRILLNDRTAYGLHRMVIYRKDDWPDVEGFMKAAEQKAKGAQVNGWLIEKDDGFILWIVWKE